MINKIISTSVPLDVVFMDMTTNTEMDKLYGIKLIKVHNHLVSLANANSSHTFAAYNLADNSLIQARGPQQDEIIYAEEDDEELEDDSDYIPSATREDYSPSNPWNAPGMNIHDFI